MRLGDQKKSGNTEDRCGGGYRGSAGFGRKRIDIGALALIASYFLASIR